MDCCVVDKIVAVTGSAEGIGLAILKSFLKHGAKLVICLDINETKGLSSVAELKQQYGDRAVFYKCNVTTDLNSVYDNIIRNYQKLDVLINNAGIANEESVNETFGVNIIALIEWTNKFYNHMRKDKNGNGGTIINVSSIFGFDVTPYTPLYHATKFAVLGFSKSLGHEINFKETGVRVVTLCPGFTLTSLIKCVSLLSTHYKGYEVQKPDAVGDGAVEVFEKAASGTVWVVRGSRPAQELDM